MFGGVEREFEGESGAFAQALALGAKGAAHFPGGQRAAVKAEAVTVFAGGEAVREDVRQAPRIDSRAGVGD